MDGDSVLSSKTYFHPNIYPAIVEEASKEKQKAEEKKALAQKNKQLAKTNKNEKEMDKFKEDELQAKRDLDELPRLGKRTKRFCESTNDHISG